MGFRVVIRRRAGFPGGPRRTLDPRRRYPGNETIRTMMQVRTVPDVSRHHKRGAGGNRTPTSKSSPTLVRALRPSSAPVFE
jgi:hypothetical protein